MMIGSATLLEKYGSRLKVAEAFIKGKINSYEETFLWELVDKNMLEAARIRISFEREKERENESREDRIRAENTSVGG
jgi:hypothetical protein